MKDIKASLARRIGDITSLSEQDILQAIEYPPNLDLGDLAIPCFRFARTLRKSPNQIAADISSALQDDENFSDVAAVNGYVNVKLRREPYANEIVAAALDNIQLLFSRSRGGGQEIAIEYSSPNIAKPFGVGHLRSTIIGESLSRMFKEDGYQVIKMNHLGDWGTQFGKTIVAYLKWGSEDAVRANPVRELFQLYVKFHQEAEQNPELDDEARAWFKKLEDGDKEAVRLWKWFITESLAAFRKVYDLLGVEFDHYLGESFYNDKMQAVVDELDAKGLLVESDGAQVVDLSEWNMPPCIILKSDGATIYATRDLAAADYRHKVLGATRLIYVVGAEQTLHFQQIFKVLGLMGRDWVDECQHVAFGLMKLDGQKMSTRRGKTVYLEDVLNHAIQEALQIIETKNPNLPDKYRVAEMVGIGAVIFNDLKTYRMHEVDFRLEDVLNFDGETGPYAQYSHARACSVLRKAEEQGLELPTSNVQFADVTASEWALIYQLGQANELLERAIDDLDPSIMARFALNVCHAFNRFYHDNPILTAEADIRTQRLALTAATRNVLAHALSLVGVNSPTAM